jgi:hypothetical protein
VTGGRCLAISMLAQLQDRCAGMSMLVLSQATVQAGAQLQLRYHFLQEEYSPVPVPAEEDSSCRNWYRSCSSCSNWYLLLQGLQLLPDAYWQIFLCSCTFGLLLWPRCCASMVTSWSQWLSQTLKTTECG